MKEEKKDDANNSSSLLFLFLWGARNTKIGCLTDEKPTQSLCNIDLLDFAFFFKNSNPESLN